MTEKRSSEILGGTFLIGLAILFLTGWWWPGIMYVIGIALIARTVSEGRNWTDERAGLISIGIGVFFTALRLLSVVINWWPLILVVLGLYLLFGNRRGGNWGGNWNRSSDSEEKPKRDDLV